MAVPSNAALTYSRNGIKQDLNSVINNTSPSETPFLSLMKESKKKATTITPEEQEETYRAGNPANAQLQGEADVATTATLGRDLVTVPCQIFSEKRPISSTLQATEMVGPSELTRMKIDMGIGLKRDREQCYVSNRASVLPASGVAPNAAGIQAMLTTNTNRGLGGVNGGYNTGTKVFAAATNGTQRAITVALIDDVARKIYEAGSEPMAIYTGSSVRSQISALARTASNNIAVNHSVIAKKNPAIISASVGIYVTDYGELGLFPMRAETTGTSIARAAIMISDNPIVTKTHEPLAFEKLPKTSLLVDNYEAKIVQSFYCHQKAHGIIADLS
jgi:hypothetical protein